LNVLDTVLEAACRPRHLSSRGMGGSFIFSAVTAVWILIVAVGIFYVLVKRGDLIVKK
jgi:hypothetical protein